VNADSIRELFDQVRRGKLSPDAAVDRLRHLPFEDLGFANLDHHRALRNGMPEVIFGPGKTPAQVASIFSRLAKHGGNILATRVSAEQLAAVKKKVPKVEYQALARAITLRRDRKKHGKGIIAVVSAGTSDIPVAEEAVVTAEMMGNDVEHLYDVGVAGIHRLLANRASLTRARVVIVCAGGGVVRFHGRTIPPYRTKRKERFVLRRRADGMDHRGDSPARRDVLRSALDDDGHSRRRCCWVAWLPRRRAPRPM